MQQRKIAWRQVKTVLRETKGCRKETLARLGIGHSTLYRYLAQSAPDELHRPRGEHRPVRTGTTTRKPQQQPQCRRLAMALPSQLTPTRLREMLAAHQGSVLRTALALGVEFEALYNHLKEEGSIDADTIR